MIKKNWTKYGTGKIKKHKKDSDVNFRENKTGKNNKKQRK